MFNFTDIMNELDGNGMSETEVLAISNDLTQFTKLRDKLIGPLSGVYSADQLKEILLVIEPASTQRQMMASIFKNLSDQEKKCFILHTVENLSMSAIALQLGISKGSVNSYIRRARDKVQQQNIS